MSGYYTNAPRKAHQGWKTQRLLRRKPLPPLLLYYKDAMLTIWLKSQTSPTLSVGFKRLQPGKRRLAYDAARDKPSGQPLVRQGKCQKIARPRIAKLFPPLITINRNLYCLFQFGTANSLDTQTFLKIMLSPFLLSFLSVLCFSLASFRFNRVDHKKMNCWLFGIFSPCFCLLFFSSSCPFLVGHLNSIIFPLPFSYLSILFSHCLFAFSLFFFFFL